MADIFKNTTPDSFNDSSGVVWESLPAIAFEDTVNLQFADQPGDRFRSQLDEVTVPPHQTSLYVNGEHILTIDASTDLITADSGGSFLGQLQGILGGSFSNSLDGVLSRIRLYKEKLLPIKIKTLFDELKSAPTGNIVYYKMDELPTTVITDSLGNDNGTAIGNISIADGVLHGAYGFNGAAAITLDNFAARLSSSTTMLGLSFWMKTNTTPTTNPSSIFSLSNNSGTNLLNVGIHTDGRLYVETPDLGSIGISLNSVIANVWNKYHVIFYQNNCYLYFNKQITNISRLAGFGSIMPNVTKVTIGAEYNNVPALVNFFNGQLDDFRIYLDTDINAAEEVYLFDIPGDQTHRLNSKLNIQMKSNRDTYDSFRTFNFDLNRHGYGYGYGNFYGGN